MLILAAIMCASQGEKSSFCNVERPQFCRSQPTQLHAQSTSLTATLSPRSTHACFECAFLTGILSCIKFTHRSERQRRLKKANI